MKVLFFPKKSGPACWLRALLGGIFLISGGPIHAEVPPRPCPDVLSPWLNAKAEVTEAFAHGDSQKQAAAEQKEWKHRQNTAKALFAGYLAGKFEIREIERCLEKDPERQNFFNSLYAAFLDESLAKLRASNTGPVSTLIRLLDRKYSGNSTLRKPLFRVTGLAREQSPTHLKGGFHRASGSVFMDISKVQPNEWLIILVHELLHNVDEQIPLAAAEFANSSRILEMSNTTTHYTDLSPAQKSELRKWIEAGLDRGLWAEYRAWVATLVIYEAGLREGLWSNITWIDELLKAKPPGVALESHIYRFLDSHSEDPTDPVFSRPLIRDTLKQVRAEVIQTGKYPSLWNLSNIISSTE